MTTRDKIGAACIAALLAFLAVLFVGVWTEVHDCEAKGGKRLRGTFVWQSFECYDAGTLRVLK
jgi:hypothetical protein